MSQNRPEDPKTADKHWIERNWKILITVGCTGAFLLFICVIVALFMLTIGVLKSSEPYTTNTLVIPHRPEVQKALGKNIEIGWFVKGHVRRSVSSGEAQLEVPLKGSKAKGKLYIEAIMEAGMWRTTVLRLQVTDSGESIDLLNPKNNNEQDERGKTGGVIPAY